MKLHLCEKPSQAGDTAAVLGNRRRRNGYYDTATDRDSFTLIVG